MGTKCPALSYPMKEIVKLVAFLVIFIFNFFFMSRPREKTFDVGFSHLLYVMCSKFDLLYTYQN